MICYRDMTFCNAECGNTECRRNFTEELREDAIKWWGNENFPVAKADFKTGCLNFKEKA